MSSQAGDARMFHRGFRPVSEDTGPPDHMLLAEAACDAHDFGVLPYTSGPSDAPGRRSCNDLVRSLSYSPARVTAMRPERTNSVMR